MRIIDSNAVEVQLSYDEPSKDSDTTPTILTDNPPLADLSYTSVFYKIGAATTVVAGGVHPASSPAGGGHVAAPLIVPAPVNQRTTIDFWVTSTDLAGNSQGETHATLIVDRMAPLPPSGFTVA